MKKIFVYLMSVVAISIQAQVNDTVSLKETVISASRWEQPIKAVAARVVGVTAKSNEFQNSQTTADLLQNTGQIFVQKSQTAGGSPVLRGFETNRVLLVVDGVRMNNAIYRGGHVQDVVTLDNAILDKTEILFGPSSTLYGSDALGGVVHFYTKNPKLNKSSVNAYVRYSSANNEKTAHVDFNVGNGNFARLTSITYSDFGDLRVGKSGSFGQPNGYGACAFYVTRDKVNKKDIVNVNTDPSLMVGSAYKQLDVMEKVLFQQNKYISHVLNLQYSTNIGNVPRYDRMLEYSYNADLTPKKPTFAENAYGPQNRFLGAYTLDFNKKNIFSDDAKLILSYQAIDQDRIQRKLNKVNRRTQMEDLTVWSANFDLTKALDATTTLYYGLEETYNNAKSSVRNEDVNIGAELGGADSRYPDGGSVWNSAAAYVQANKTLSDIFSVSGGVRLTSVYMRTNFKDSLWTATGYPLKKFPFDKMEMKAVAPCGNLSFVANLPTETKISAIVSNGFRAPNIDDMVKLYDNTGTKTVTVLNPNLKPEYAYNGELNVTQRFDNYGSVKAGAYYTILDNALTVQPDKFNGEDFLVVDGTKLQVVSVQNANSARIWGFYADATFMPIHNLNVKGSLTSTYGKYTDAGTVVPMDHIPPMYGKVSVDYTYKNLKMEGFVRFSAAKKLADYSPSGEDNLSQTPISGSAGLDANGDPILIYSGTPSWYTLNFRAAYTVTKNLSLNAGVENILDTHYRQFASGISAPGRNIYGTVRLRF